MSVVKEMTKEEKCRLVAKELLGWKQSVKIHSEINSDNSPLAYQSNWWYDADCKFVSFNLPDFYLDEARNAEVLEKMKRSLLYSDWPGCEGWRVDIGVEYYQGPPLGPTYTDRKTAIIEAAVKLILSEKGGGSHEFCGGGQECNR